MKLKTEYIPENSIFITKDPRKDRWAIPFNHEAVNVRAQTLLDENIEHIQGKRILDLGCHFGTFSYIALQLGAKSVLGVDSSVDLIKQAKEMFTASSVPKDKYDFIIQDVITYLENLSENSFDTILCFGLLYYIPDNYHFLKLLKKTAKDAILIDTFTAYYSLIQGKDAVEANSIIKDDILKLPVMMHSLTQTDKKYYSLPESFRGQNKKLSFLTCPTIPLLQLYFRSLGFKFRQLDWSQYLKNPQKNWQDLISSQGKIGSHWTDIYSTDIRVSYLLTL